MKKHAYLLSLAIMAMMTINAIAAPELTYNGEVLPWNTEWKRSMCGALNITNNIIEVSGIACSRVTPGYIWMQSDETEKYIIATDEQGENRACKIKFTNTIRWDWEDLSGGIYNEKNYLFIGAFGDNNETDGEYNIVYFEEPAIPSGNQEISVTPSAIKYQYPNGKKHNTEALMYDNLSQTIYIITKKYYNVCQVFSLPFRLDYGTEIQTVTYVCDLGVKADLGEGDKPDKGFHLVTAADISPDGKYILIKNQNNTNSQYSWILYWERQDGESVEDAIKRQPQPLSCYEVEWQGEAICWLDDNTFYTTSDSDDGNPPIYKYTHQEKRGPTPKRDIVIDGDLSEWEDLSGLGHAELNQGAELKGLLDLRAYADENFLYFYLELDEDKAATVDIMLNTDNNSSTGHTSWLWGDAAADYLIENEWKDNFSGSSLNAFDNTAGQDSWSWIDSGIENIYACNPVSLVNGHSAIEGSINLSLFPEVPKELKLGVFSSDTNWNESGCLPNLYDSMLEVPIYITPTGLKGIKTTENCKVLRDGKLYIIREGRTYTITGAEIK